MTLLLQSENEPHSHNLKLIIHYLLQDGKTALHLAAEKGHSETVAALIMNGADISAQDFVSAILFLM